MDYSQHCIRHTCWDEDILALRMLCREDTAFYVDASFDDDWRKSFLLWGASYP